MGMPSGIGIIDTMISFPHGDMKELYSFITKQTKDAQSKDEFEFPVEYMFKDVPDKGYRDVDDPISVTLHEMDRWGIEKGLIGVGTGGTSDLALKGHPDRFIAQVGADPNQGMEAVRKIVRAHEEHDVKAIGMFPAGLFPQVAINDKKMYPIYAKAWSSASRCSAAPACPARACASSRRRSSTSTRSCTTSPSWCSSPVTGASRGRTSR